MHRLLVLTLLTMTQGLRAENTPPAPAPSATTTIVTPTTAPAPKPEVAAPQNQVSDLNSQRDKIAAELALNQAKLDQELAASKANTVRLQAELAEMKAKQDLEDYKAKQAQDK